MFPTTYKPLQMQGMDKKYDGHAWCKWSQPISRIILGLALGKLIAWVTYNVFMIICAHWLSQW
jgi:hypothetical protein